MHVALAVVVQEVFIVVAVFFLLQFSRHPVRIVCVIQREKSYESKTEKQSKLEKF